MPTIIRVMDVRPVAFTALLVMAFFSGSRTLCSADLPEKPPEKRVLKVELADYAKDIKDLYTQKPEVLERCKKYNGVWLEISGKVTTIGVNELLPDKWGYSVTVTTDQPNSTTLALCFPESQEPWKKVGSGCKVTLRGVHGVNGALYHCTFTQVKGSPCPVLTADQVLKEFVKDPAAAEKKYDDQYVVVTGVLKEPFARDDEARALRSTLKVAGKLPFILDNDNGEGRRLFKDAKAGDKVTLVGQLDVDKSEEAKPVILKEVIPATGLTTEENSPESTKAKPMTTTNLPHAKIGVEFAEALVAGDFQRASTLLSSDLGKTLSAKSLQQKYEDMMPPASRFGPPTSVKVMETLEKFPKKQSDDVGWAYVAISGKSFSEGVSVVVANESGRHVIRDIKWGRP